MPKPVKYALVSIALVTWLVFVWSAWGNYYADVLHHQGKIRLAKGEISVANDFVAQAIKVNPYEPAYHRSKATIYLAYTSVAENAEQKRQIKELALAELKAAYTLQPINLVNVKGLISLYYYLALADITQPEVLVFDDYSNVALGFFRQVDTLAPTDLSTYLLLGTLSEKLGDEVSARNYLEKVESIFHVGKEIMTNRRGFEMRVWMVDGENRICENPDSPTS